LTVHHARGENPLAGLRWRRVNGPSPIHAYSPTRLRYQYVTIKTFVEALRKLVLSELEPQLLHAGRQLSETPPFPWSRPTLKASKCVFNLVPCDNEFEKEFAQFLEKADDVVRFAKLPEQFGLSGGRLKIPPFMFSDSTGLFLSSAISHSAKQARKSMVRPGDRNALAGWGCSCP
jgi:hypothetical protein